MEGVDLVDALAVVEAGLTGTLVDVDVAVHTLVPFGTDRGRRGGVKTTARF